MPANSPEQLALQPFSFLFCLSGTPCLGKAEHAAGLAEVWCVLVVPSLFGCIRAEARCLGNSSPLPRAPLHFHPLRLIFPHSLILKLSCCQSQPTTWPQELGSCRTREEPTEARTALQCGWETRWAFIGLPGSGMVIGGAPWGSSFVHRALHGLWALRLPHATHSAVARSHKLTEHAFSRWGAGLSPLRIGARPGRRAAPGTGRNVRTPYLRSWLAWSSPTSRRRGTQAACVACRRGRRMRGFGSGPKCRELLSVVIQLRPR